MPTKKMTEKQTWLRKELQNFLDKWAEVTKEKISGYNQCWLFSTKADEGDHYTKTNRYFLARGINSIDSEKWACGPEEWEESTYIDLKTCHIGRVKKAIEAIDDKLPKYFSGLETATDELTEYGEMIRVITRKLTAE